MQPAECLNPADIPVSIFTAKNNMSDICTMLMWEHADRLGTERSHSACIKNTRAPHQLGEDGFIEYVWCLLEKIAEKKKFPSIKELLKWSIIASSIGYTFRDEDQRRSHYNLVEKLPEIDWYINNHCYGRTGKGQRPRYYQIYCSQGRLSHVGVNDYCWLCWTYCTYNLIGMTATSCINATNECATLS